MAKQITDLVRLAEQYEKRRAEKISLFFKLIKDPVIQPYLELLRDGEPKKHKKKIEPTPGFKNGNGLRDTIRSLNLPQRFSAKQVWETLRKQQFHFAATDERGAVSDALYTMARGMNPQLKRVKGEGGNVLYEKL